MTEHVVDSIPAYALGALDDAEAAAVEEHLRACDDCRLALRSMEEIVSSMPLALEEARPPAELRRRILRAAVADIDENPQPDQSVAGPGRPSTLNPQPSTPAPISIRPRLQPRIHPGALSLVAAAAVVLFAIGLTVGNLLRPGTSAQARYNQLVAAAVDQGDRLAALTPSATSAPRTEMVLALSRTGTTQLILGPSSPPPRGRVFQLWYIRGKQAPVSLGVFTPTRSEARALSLPRSALGYDVAAMTVEPGPLGTAEPTTKPFVEADVSNL